MHREDRKHWQTVAVLLVVSLLLIWQPWTRWAWRHTILIERLGHALLIAGILAATVDLYLGKHMLRRIAQDVYQYIVGHPLPKELQDRIHSLICADLIRREWKITYTLTHSTPGRVSVIVDLEFQLQNLSSTPLTYQQVLKVEAHDRPMIKRLSCDSTEADTNYAKHDKNTLGKEDRENPGVISARGEEITVRPNLDDPQIRYTVGGRYEMDLPEEYSDVISFDAPAINVVVRADCPTDMDVLISSDPNTRAREGRWEFNRAFTRSEHIRIRWFKKPRAN